MNRQIEYKNKLWSYLQKLLKPGGESFLLSSTHNISAENTAIENIVIEATTVDFDRSNAHAKSSTNLRNKLLPTRGLLGRFLASFLLIEPVNSNEIANKHQRNTKDIAKKEHRIGKQRASVYPSRSLAEATKQPRNAKETAMNKQRNSTETAEHHPSNSRAIAQHCRALQAGVTRIVPSVNQIRTLFYLRPSMHRNCTVGAPSHYREKDGASALQVLCKCSEVCNKVKSGLKESPNKVRMNLDAFLSYFIKKRLFKTVFDVPLLYGEFTGVLPKRYRRGTTKVRDSYQKGTNASSFDVELHPMKGHAIKKHRLIAKVSKMLCYCVAKVSVKHMLSTGKAWIVLGLKNALTQISVFKPLKFFRWVNVWFCNNDSLDRLKCFSNKAQGGGEDAEDKLVVRLFSSARFSMASLLLLFMTFGSGYSHAQSKQNYVLQGKVVSAVDKKPLEGVSVRVEAEDIKTSTKKDGSFSVPVAHRKGKVKLTYVGYKTVELEYVTGIELLSQLNALDNQLDEVEVVSTGFQKIPKERATGSFVTIDRELLDRRVSTSIIDRLEGVTSGLVFNKTIQPGENESPLSIRGRSTLFGNTKPLIVVDNFPYEGDIDNIDPNSIANITVLKDAAASSIWGARSGNGVIVLTTKQGNANRPPTVDFSTSVNIGAKPDLYYYPRMSNTDYIEVERELFNKGLFNGRINSNPRRPLSDAVELLLKERNGELSATETQAALERLASHDVRKDLDRYFYRPSVNQRYGVDISGGAKRIRYYFGVGYDHNQDNRIRNGMERVTVTNRNHYTLIENKLELSSTIALSTRKTDRSSNAESALSTWPYLYARLADDQGNALAIPITHSFSYTDTAGQGLLDDWLFRPVDELYLRSNTSSLVDYRIGSTLKYSPMKGLSTTLLYQYYSGNERTEKFNDAQSYFVRDMVNQFTQLDLAGGRILKRAVPQGAILDRNLDRYVSHNVRALAEYNFRTDKSDLAVLVGAEVSDFVTETDGSRLYGYDERNATSIAVDLVNTYPTLPTESERNIQNLAEHSFASDRYVSYFGNFSYTYRGRYTLSGSARKDASNLFGVNANQRSVPLWSTGLLWDIGKETGYSFETLPILKLRVTYGYNGNVDKTVSAYTTASVGLAANRYGANYFTVQNPPNAELRWEQIGMLNMGLDFGFRNQRLSGSVEYFLKKGKDLIGNRPLPPSAGITQFKGNNANLNTYGLDVQLNSINTMGDLRWNTNALLSLTNDRVTKYLGRPMSPGAYVQNNFSYPYEGKPYNSIFALRWAGLDPQTGAPRGYKDGAVSMDYTRLVGVTDDSEIIYAGRGRAGVFGALRNTFGYRGMELSFNVTYKLGFYFKAPAVSYQTLLMATGGNTLQPGYEQRWQQPGDEEQTHVPAFYYPVNNNREVFYKNAEVHVQRGDHIRLQDVQAAYRIKANGISWLREMKVFAYANNLGLLWKASDHVLDPDYIRGTPPPFSLALGLNIGFN